MEPDIKVEKKNAFSEKGEKLENFFDGIIHEEWEEKINKKLKRSKSHK